MYNIATGIEPNKNKAYINGEKFVVSDVVILNSPAPKVTANTEPIKIIIAAINALVAKLLGLNIAVQISFALKPIHIVEFPADGEFNEELKKVGLAF